MVVPKGASGRKSERELLLDQLASTVAEAAEFLAEAKGSLHDGHQTAREVLSHIVFWHREYVAIVESLIEGRSPTLKQGTFADLNAAAAGEFNACPMDDLAGELLRLQDRLNESVCRLPDWEVDFPVKRSGRRKHVAGRLAAVEAHIRNHVRRLRRAQRLGQAWVSAYYADADGGG
jgi:hypothetical protein